MAVAKGSSIIHNLVLETRALLHELKLSLNPKLSLSSRIVLVKMALIICCIKQF